MNENVSEVDVTAKVPPVKDWLGGIKWIKNPTEADIDNESIITCWRNDADKEEMRPLS